MNYSILELLLSLIFNLQWPMVVVIPPTVGLQPHFVVFRTLYGFVFICYYPFLMLRILF